MGFAETRRNRQVVVNVTTFIAPANTIFVLLATEMPK
jgi:hypothetical protein